MTTDVHQLLFGEIGIARHLVTGIATGVGCEEHQRLLTLVDEFHVASGGQVVLTVAQHSIHQTVGIPHALPCVTGVVRIDGLDGVIVGIRQIDKHILGQIVHQVTDITGRHDQIDCTRQLFVEHGRLLRSCTHVIATQTVTALETA